MSVITLKHVSYQYPLEDRKVIRDFTYEFQQGKVYGLIGENESGKTTLCNIIRGFIPELYRGKLSGEVLLNQKPISEYNSGELAAVIGYSFQNPFVQISGVKDTVFEEIAYGMENIGIAREEMLERVENLVKLFQLEKLVDKNPYELSGGQKQRVALASVIALNPEIVILDEPTSQLDPKSTEDIFDIISILKKQGKTIILIEHKIDLVAEYCDEILLMNQGKLVMHGAAKEVLKNPAVLRFGGQLPQVVLYYLAQAKRDGSRVENIPLTVKEAYQWMIGGRS